MKFPSISPILKFILKFFCAILFRLVNVCFRWTRWGGAYASPLCTPLFQTDSPTVIGYFGSVWVKETQAIPPTLSHKIFISFFSAFFTDSKNENKSKIYLMFLFSTFCYWFENKNIKTFFFYFYFIGSKKLNKYVFPSFWVFSKKKNQLARG